MCSKVSQFERRAAVTRGAVDVIRVWGFYCSTEAVKLYPRPLLLAGQVRRPPRASVKCVWMPVPVQFALRDVCLPGSFVPSADLVFIIR